MSVTSKTGEANSNRRRRPLVPWSFLVEGDEGLFLPNCQTNLLIALHAPSLLFWHFINTTAYHLGRYEASSPGSCRAPPTELFNAASLGSQMSSLNTSLLLTKSSLATAIKIHTRSNPDTASFSFVPKLRLRDHLFGEFRLLQFKLV